MSLEQNNTSTDRFDVDAMFGRDDSTSLMPLSERIDHFRSQSPRTNTETLPADGILLCSADSFSKTNDALGKWGKISSDVQAGSGKSITLELDPDGSGTKKYTIPLDDIGNKKGEIWTNGKEVQFRQTDGDIWDSKYNLGWYKEKGAVKFVWR